MSFLLQMVCFNSGHPLTLWCNSLDLLADPAVVLPRGPRWELHSNGLSYGIILICGWSPVDGTGVRLGYPYRMGHAALVMAHASRQDGLLGARTLSLCIAIRYLP
jgi:hypothetical protein